jgi:hypothetical protein
MSSIFEKAKKVVEAVLHPNRQAESNELAYLRAMYEKQTGGGKLNQWYRLASESGDLVGFCFCCPCGTEYEILSFNHWMQSWDCATCKTVIDLYKAVGITSDTPIADHKALLMKLPLRPRLQGRPSQPPFIRTGDWGDGDPTEGATGWDGARDAEARADINKGLW